MPQPLSISARNMWYCPLADLADGVITQWAAVGLTVEPKVLALVYGCFLWQFPNLERIQGVLDGVRRGPAVGPPGTLELAARSRT
jgi:hypothetical protein